MGKTGFYQTSSESIIKQIQERAQVSVPEWKFDTEKPDMGTVLALLFADMMKESAKRFYQTLEQYPVYFYNLLDASLLPAKSAEGYVTFSTVNDEVAGVMVEEGTQVFAEGEDGGKLTFKTQEDVFVSPAELNHIFYINGSMDIISQPLSLPLRENQLENRQSHHMYIGHPYLFFIDTEGEIVIDFHFLSSAHEKELEKYITEQISWSYSGGEGFVEFSNLRYEQGKLYLYKKEHLPAFKKKNLQGRDYFWICAKIKKMTPLCRITFPQFSILSAGDYIVPELIFNGDMELDQDSFLPFGEHPYTFAELYIGSAEVFYKKGAQIKICFDLTFEKIPGELVSPEIPIYWRSIMHQSEFKEKKQVDITINTVIWEYYNGHGWTKIPGSKRYESIFAQQGNQQRKTVEFLCPEDIYPFFVSARETGCIRMRITKMSGNYVMDGIYIVPHIKNITLHYKYGECGKKPEYVYAVNELIERQMPCDRECVPFYNDFPGKSMLYLAFSKPLDEEMIHLLVVLEQQSERKKCLYNYEYYSKQGFQPLKADDETDFFSRTGSLIWEAQHHFVKQSFFGYEGYWIRFLTEERENEPFAGFMDIQDILPDSVMAFAGQESGRHGNVKAGAVHIMERSIGFINKVTNSREFIGGCDKEDIVHAKIRNASSLRHLERAVTVKDFEDIVYGNIRNVRQVKCFSGKNEKGEKAPGHITVAVLFDKEEEHYFNQRREEIRKFLTLYTSEQLWQEGRIHIVKPEKVGLKVYVTVVIEPSAKHYRVKEKIKKRINDFIDPVTGNFDGKGWSIGELPSAMQVQNICNQIEEVVYVKSTSLKEETGRGTYSLGTADEHEIEIFTE